MAITDEFQLKGLFPFFATFIHELGFDLVYEKSAGPKTLKRGIEEANVPFCAPMQLYHGLVASMAERDADYLFVPMVRDMPRVGAGAARGGLPRRAGEPGRLAARPRRESCQEAPDAR